eukprot:TRINITY_DN2799_c0_g2_i1.p3 TRINITY_DN2799_c0_g2~~TRINITY_DN2799_c0_g2_i1.p3  ORF type:complete len:105 (+),score=18.82 TRINITY_DN2799_c0_g2_i1:307-621(+)
MCLVLCDKPLQAWPRMHCFLWTMPQSPSQHLRLHSPRQPDLLEPAVEGSKLATSSITSNLTTSSTSMRAILNRAVTSTTIPINSTPAMASPSSIINTVTIGQQS